MSFNRIYRNMTDFCNFFILFAFHQIKVHHLTASFGQHSYPQHDLSDQFLVFLAVRSDIELVFQQFLLFVAADHLPMMQIIKGAVSGET